MLWSVATGTTLTVFRGHTGAIYAVAFSPDGGRILTGSDDQTAILWDAQTGTSVTRLTGHTNGVSAVAFSPDGTLILTAGWESVTKIWSATDGHLIRTITDSGPPAGFSPDGKKFFCQSSYGLRIRNVSDGSEIRTITGYCGAFSPDGTRILTANYGVVRIWWLDPPSLALRGHVPALSAVAVSGDLKLIATGHDDNAARLWKTVDGALVRTFTGHTQPVSCVALSTSGTRLVTGSEDNTVKLWNANTGLVLRTFVGHTGRINTVCFSTDETKILSSCDDGFAVLWNIADGAALQTFSGHGGAIYAAALSRDGGRVVTGGADSNARIWNVSTGDEIRPLIGHWSGVYSVAFSYDGLKILSGAGDGTAKFWNANDGGLLHTFPGHTGDVISVAFSPDATRVITASEKTCKLWDVTSETVLTTIEHLQPVVGATLSSDGTRIVSGSEEARAFLWSAFPSAGAGPVLPPVAGDKVILVAGGGNYIGNPIVTQTQALADRVFFTCLVRGYTPADIRYLSAFTDWQTRDSNGDGLPDAYGQATAARFWSAVDSWSSQTARLFIYLIDHGTTNGTDYYFRINLTESIRARDLDGHLDALQARTGCEVILIVDCCFSGGFVQQCRAPSGKRRVVLCSTTPNALAIYSPPSGAESFSFYFLSYAILGNTLQDSFNWTRLSFGTMGNPAGQDPWMDDNNDGQSNKWDGSVAARHVFGRYPAFGLMAPIILDVATTQTAVSGRPALLWARLDATVAARQVWAVVVPRNSAYSSGQPVTDLIRVNLVYSATLGRWQASWTPTYRHVGQCSVTYFAESEDSLGTRLVATPKSAGLRVVGPAASHIPWTLLR